MEALSTGQDITNLTATAARLGVANAPAVSVLLIPRVVPPYASGILGRRQQLQGLAGLAVSIGKTVNVHDTREDARFNDKVEVSPPMI